MNKLKEAAKSTFTLPNAISIAGYLAVKKGIKEGVDTPRGVFFVGLGRVLDLVDGHVARKLGQSSQFGALLDATLDKRGMKDIHDALVEKEILSDRMSQIIVGQELSNAGLTFATKLLNPKQN